MTHTPGPWVLKDEHLRSQVLVTGGTTRIVRFGPRENWDAVDHGNAQLIAAAPDLLGACVTVLDELKKGTTSGRGGFSRYENERCQSILQSEITKARGRPPKEKD